MDQPTIEHTATATASAWRLRFRVHPSADVFPMMSDEELAQLGKNIVARGGLTSSIVLWRAPGGQLVLLDGRNRLEALERIGAVWQADDSVKLPGGKVIRIVSVNETTTDPAAYVIAVNIRRRHLTKQQRADLIVMVVEAARNDTAKMARSFSPVSGERGGSTKDPALTIEIEEGAKCDVSERTIRRSRAKLQGKTPTRKPTTRRSETTIIPASPPPAAIAAASADLTAAMVRWNHDLQEWEERLRQVVPDMQYGEDMLPVAKEFRDALRQALETTLRFLDGLGGEGAAERTPAIARRTA
jgi:hypothetical protein